MNREGAFQGLPVRLLRSVLPRVLALTLVLGLCFSVRVASAKQTLPTPSIVPIEGRADAIDKHFKHTLDAIEGIWLVENSVYEIAIIRAPSEFEDHCDYVGAITSTTKSGWKPGQVKFLLTASATSGLFSLIYLDGMRNVRKTWARLSDNNVLTLDLSSTFEKPRYLRIYPKADRQVVGRGNPPASGVSGTGFVVGPGIVVTSHHLVADSKRVEVIVGPLRVSANVLLQDEQNDLAVLQLQSADSLVSAMLNQNTRCLSVRTDGSPTAGERVFTLGFPLAGMVNDEIVITEGVVSSDVGLNSDTNMLQTTAAIQPGSSGGPLLDQFGRVVGVMSATINSSFVYRQTGALPQSINFAVSSRPLAAMMGFLPGKLCEGHPVPGSPRDGQGIKTSCSKGIVRVVAQ